MGYIEWSFFACLFTRKYTHNKARAFPAFEVGDLISLCFAIKSAEHFLSAARRVIFCMWRKQWICIPAARVRPERLKNYQEHRNLKDFGAGLEESGRFSEIPASLVAQQISKLMGEQMQKKTLVSLARDAPVELLFKVVPSYLIWTCPPFSPKKTQLISTHRRAAQIILL
jgi:hypothetical protein